MEFQYVKQKKCSLLKTIWKCKHASESLQLRHKLQKRLVKDTLQLYESSELVDLVLQTYKGTVYCHRVVVASRSPAFWDLLSKIVDTQSCYTENRAGILTVRLPKVEYIALETFIRSLYTNSINKEVEYSLKDLLEKSIFTLQHQHLSRERRLILEKLDLEEKKRVQQLIFEQICTGEISHQRGNLRDLSICLRRKHCPQFYHGQLSNHRERVCGQSISLYNHLTENRITPPQHSFDLNGLCRNHDDTIDGQLQHLSMSSNISDNSSETFPEKVLSPDYSSTSKTDPERNSIIKNATNTNFASVVTHSLHHGTNESRIETPVSPLPDPDTSLLQTVDRNSQLSQNDSTSLSSSLPDPDVTNDSSHDDKTFSVKKQDDQHIAPDLTSRKNTLFEGNTSLSHIESKASPSDMDHSLFHETSSLEVEPSSSYEDQSLSADSVKSEDRSSNQSSKEENERKTISTHPYKPLVRTRTFEIIDPGCMGQSAHEVNPSSLEAASSHRNVEQTVRSSEFPHQSEGNLIQNFMIRRQQSESEEPVDKRELERLKGSLLFENNFQTFSNIPTTNMMTSGLMNMSVSSENSMGAVSLYTSMTNSVHSALTSDSHPPIVESQSVSMVTLPFLSSTNEFADNTEPGTLPTTTPFQTCDELTMLNVEEGRNLRTRSPSPDSLCIDVKDPCSQNKSLKEKYDDEIKEKDEQEQVHKTLPYGCPNDENTESTVYCIPKILSKNVPIVSSGSTLERQNSLNEDNSVRPSPPQRQISCCSVKDVDAIPVVTGYVALCPEEPTEEKTVGNERKNVTQDDSKGQSMFSMFIDFNELPSSDSDQSKSINDPKEKLNKKAPGYGGVYMFIEADTPSPKIKSRTCSEHEESKYVPKITAPATRTFTKNNLVPKDQHHVKDIAEKPPLEKKPEKEKKGFFIFIDADDSSQSNSPKLRKRPVLHRKQNHSSGNMMSKSAPSDSHLFEKEDPSSKIMNPESSSKFMTKSVIDRDEFMSQSPARRNVSLNDKINESSSKIPRPVANFRAKLAQTKSWRERPNYKEEKIVSKNKKAVDTELNGNNADILSADIAGSLNVSFEENSLNIPVNIGEVSEASDVSSLLSSLDRSNDVSDHEGKSSKTSLGDDLLKMFCNEVDTDVVIQVGDKRIKAHKCVLAFRCAYFAAIFSGRWLESTGNVIKLKGFSYESVMVALKHIYSGASKMPEGAKVEELAALADMLSLDGLKDVVSLHLRANQCHYFHKPCAECLNGILEVLPLASAYGLDDLYRKSLQWAAKNFVVFFPTRNFASLPPELQDRCVKQILDDMCVSNVIDTALGCQRILSLLPVVRWSQSLFHLTTQMLESSTNFIAVNMSSVLESEKFISLAHDGGWSIDSLGEIMKASCDHIRPDQAVLSHIHLTKLLETFQDDSELTESFANLSDRLLKQLEKFMIHNANRVSVCRRWPLLPADTQRRIKEAALVVVEFSSKPVVALKPKFSSALRSRSRGASIEPPPRARASSMSDHRLSRSASAAVVPSKNNKSKKLQLASERCQTPPLSNLRVSLQTPPPTRASTLRAQARQAAIQRSQSVKTHSKLRVEPLSSDDGNQNISRGSTCTRSLSRPEAGQRCITPVQFGSSQVTAHWSRPNTPGVSDRFTHKRISSGPQLAALRDPIALPEDRSRKTSFTSKSRPLSSASDSPLTSKMPRVHSLDVHANSIGKENILNTRTSDRSTGLKSNYTGPILNNGTSTNPQTSDNGSPPGLGNRSNTFSKDDQ